MGENSTSKSSVLGVVITTISIPIIASSVAFITELAYFNYFKMPAELIEISFSNVFDSIITTALIFIWFFCSSIFFLNQNNRIFKDNTIQTIFGLVLPIMFLLLFLFSLSLLYDAKYELLLLILAFFIFVFFILSIFVNKINQQGKFSMGTIIFYFGVVALILPLLFSSSKTDAQEQKDFIFLKSSPERIILRMYKDITIVAPFDRANKIIDPTYTILKTPDISSPIKLERIGKMKVKSQIENVNAGKSDKKIETKKK